MTAQHPARRVVAEATRLPATTQDKVVLDLGTDDGHHVLLAQAGGQVVMDWHGPPHAELSPEAAITLGYVLRGYGRAVEHPDAGGSTL